MATSFSPLLWLLVITIACTTLISCTGAASGDDQKACMHALIIYVSQINLSIIYIYIQWFCKINLCKIGLVLILFNCAVTGLHRVHG